jgi:hypothetical protein
VRVIAASSALTIVAVSVLWAADKDTQAATATRKKLTIKISVDYKDEYFSEIIKDLKRQIEDGGGGALSTVNDAGVSNNTKYSFAAKDQTVADVLDGLCKKNGLGYIVISKPGDRYDGWIKFKQGNERGYPAGEEPKAKGVSKSPQKDAEKPAGGDDKDEKAAAGKLDLARELIKDGKKDRARQRLEELIKSYPQTKAAGEAKKELDKLNGP